MPKEQTKEVGTVIPTEEQLAQLRAYLAGNKVFGRCRGCFDDLPTNEFLKMPTPSATLRAFDEWAADRKVMLNKLAKLGRDGHNFAQTELWEALTGDYVISGEEFPLEQTEPGVLVIFDLEKTLLMARWLYTSRFKEDGVYWAENGHGDPERGLCGSLTPKLFETFPELRDKFLRQKNRSHIVSPTEALFNPVVKPGLDRLDEKLSMYRVRHRCMHIDNGRTDLWYWIDCLAVFIADCDQAEVLSQFSREEQKNIATWRFDYPKFIRHDLFSKRFHPSMWIGIHKEEEHTGWSARWPAYVSRGCTHGFGAVILDKEKSSIFDRKDDLPVYETFVSPFPQEMVEDIEGQRLLLAFPYQG